MLVDLVCGRALNRFHDFEQRNHSLPLLIDTWRYNHVGMVGHDHRSVQIVSKGVIVANTFKDDVTRPFRQDRSILRDKRDEVSLSISLQVRQVATVEGHGRGL